MPYPHAQACTPLFVAAAMLLTSAATAQNYPNKPIRVIDAFPPGGSTDVVARIVSQKYVENPGQPWVIDSRPGAQGIIGTEIASKAQADGYTILMYTASHAIHPSVYQKMPYDLLKAFAPVTLTSSTTNILVVHPSLPVKSVKEFIALAKSRPAPLTYASAGHGSSNHVAMELFRSMAGVNLNHIPFKGSAPAVIDVLGGQIDCMIAPIPIVGPHVKSGKVRALAVTTAKRSVTVPEVPTIGEAGLPGYEATNAVGVLAPIGVPKDIIYKLNADIVRILNMPDVRERLLGLGAEPVASTPEQFGEFIRTEIPKWARVVKDSGMPLVAW